MSDNTTTRTATGISFSGVLFLVFLVLKLCHIIDWSWWWVTAPLWGSVALILVLIPIVFFGIFIHHIIHRR